MTPKEAEFFDRLPKSAKRDLSKGALRVLLAVLEFRRKDEHKVTFTDQECAQILGYHHNSVRRHYPELEAKGLIRRLDVNRGTRTIEIVFRLRPPKGAGDTNGSTSDNSSEARASVSKSARPDEQKRAPSCSKARAPSSLVDSGQIKETDPVSSPVLDLPHPAEPTTTAPTPERDDPALAEWKTMSLEERAAIHGETVPTPAEIQDWTEQASLPGRRPASVLARMHLNVWHQTQQRLLRPPEPPSKAPAPPPPCPTPSPPPKPSPSRPAGFGKVLRPDESFPLETAYRLLADPDPQAFGAHLAARYHDPGNPETIRHYADAAKQLPPDRLRGFLADLEKLRSYAPARRLSAWLADAMRAQKQPAGHPGKFPAGRRGVSQSAPTPVQEDRPHVKR